MSDRPGYSPTPPGWYEDPDRPGRQRFWNGTEWTEWRHEPEPPPTPEPPAPQPTLAAMTVEEQAVRRAHNRKVWAMVLGAVAVVFVALAIWGAVAPSHEKSPDRLVCSAGWSMVGDPGSTPIIGLNNTKASPAIQRAGNRVIENISEDDIQNGTVNPRAEPLRSALADLRRVCGNAWRA